MAAWSKAWPISNTRCGSSSSRRTATARGTPGHSGKVPPMNHEYPGFASQEFPTPSSPVDTTCQMGSSSSARHWQCYWRLSLVASSGLGSLGQHHPARLGCIHCHHQARQRVMSALLSPEAANAICRGLTFKKCSSTRVPPNPTDNR